MVPSNFQEDNNKINNNDDDYNDDDNNKYLFPTGRYTQLKEMYNM